MMILVTSISALEQSLANLSVHSKFNEIAPLSDCSSAEDLQYSFLFREACEDPAQQDVKKDRRNYLFSIFHLEHKK